MCILILLHKVDFYLKGWSQILQEDSYSDYGDYLEKVRALLMEFNTLEDQKEKTDQSK